MRFGPRTFAMVLALLAVAAGCNSRLIRPPAIVFVDGGERNVGTAVDDIRYRFPTAFTAFVPSRVPLHPRDEVNFSLRDTGEPHTVAMGRLVDSALEKVEALGPAAGLEEIEALPEMRRIPNLVSGNLRDGVPLTNRSAAERCFIGEGAPPVTGDDGAPPCEEAPQVAFDGRQDFFSSGLLASGRPFRMELAGDIEPGTYRFMCLFHRSAMTGAIEVRSPDVARPTVAELRAEAEREEDQILSSLEPPARAAVTAEGERPILAGTGPSGTTRGLVSAFLPDDATASVGEPVTWRFYRMHSVTFRSERRAREGVLLDERGETRANEEAWPAIGGAGPPPEAFRYPPPSAEIEIDGGTWDGEGTFSSGVIRAVPPASVTYTMRFSEPGTYSYTCLVHPSMRGRIEVG